MPSIRFKDKALQSEFEEMGYVTLRLLDDADIARLKSLRVEIMGSNPTANWGGFCESFNDADRRERADESIRSVIEPRLAEYLEGFRAFASSFLLKPSCADRFPVHLHTPITSDPTETNIICWCPLQAVDEENGTLEVVPRSHKLLWHMCTPSCCIFGGGDGYFRSFEDRLEKEYLVPLKLQPGEVVLFDDSLLHASGPNSTSEMRHVVLTGILPEDAIPAIFVKAESEGGGEHFEIYKLPHRFYLSGVTPGTLPPNDNWELIGTLENRNVAITEEQFKQLIANGVRIVPGVDPYDAVAHLKPATAKDAEVNSPATTPAAAVPLARRALGKLRRLAAGRS